MDEFLGMMWYSAIRKLVNLRRWFNKVCDRAIIKATLKQQDIWEKTST